MVDRAGSTNADLLADSDARQGDWLVALDQVAGRGRQGRQWVGAPGNFFGSTFVLLGPGDPVASSLSLVASLALAEALDVAVGSRDLVLKWPNDLLLDGAKLAGILLERSDNRVVVGFGVNLAAAPDVSDRRVSHLGGVVHPEAFAPLLAASFARKLDLWRNADRGLVAQAWLDRAHPLGSPLSVHDHGGSRVTGIFAGLEQDGALRLQRPDGTVEIVRSGDVTLG